MNGERAGLLLRALVRGGVRHALISPGSRNTPVVLALHALEGRDLRLHTALDERSAGFFALGLARATGAPVLLSCTSGSAGAHWLPAIIEASESRVPLIALTADRPAELQGFGAPQTIDQTRLFGGHVRLYRDLSEPPAAGIGEERWLVAAAAQALDAATGHRPGPVHLNLPFRKPLWEPDFAIDQLAPGPVGRVLRGPALPDGAALDALSDRLSSAGRGVIVAGPRDLARDRTAGDPPLRAAISRLAEALGWPILAEPASQLRFGLPGAIATADCLLRDPELAEALAPELVLRLGRVPTSKAIALWLSRRGAGRTVLVDPAGAWEDPTWTADTVVAAEPAALCRALGERLPTRPADPGWLALWRRADRAAREVLDRACREGLWEGAIARLVSEALPAGALLHAASSMPIRDLDSFAPAGGRVIDVAANRGANGIDGLIATALGEAVGSAGPAAALCGDLSFLHDAASLALARECRTPLALVVVDNGGGGIFHLLPIAAHPTAFEPHFLSPQPTSIPALCEAAGLPCTPCTSLKALGAALERALSRSGLSVIYARISRSESLSRREAARREAAEAARRSLR